MTRCLYADLTTGAIRWLATMSRPGYVMNFRSAGFSERFI